MPSAVGASAAVGRARIRSISASGTRTPGTSLAMNSAFRALSNGKMPAIDRQPRLLDALQEALEAATSKIGRVRTNSAPASTL